MQIGNKLKQARKQIGDKQGDAADKSGMSQRDISFLENNKRDSIPIEYIQYLNNSGINLNSLFSENEDDVDLVLSQDNIISALSKCLECQEKEKTITELREQMKFLREELKMNRSDNKKQHRDQDKSKPRSA